MKCKEDVDIQRDAIIEVISRDPAKEVEKYLEGWRDALDWVEID